MNYNNGEQFVYLLDKIKELERTNRVLREHIISFSNTAIDELNCEKCAIKRHKAKRKAKEIAKEFKDEY